MSSVVVDKIEVVRKIVVIRLHCSPAQFQSYLSVEVLLSWFIPTDYDHFPLNGVFAVIRMQPINMQGEHWTLNTNFCHNL